MVFHPERLTGKRARQWKKSVEWTPPLDLDKLPKTVLKLIHLKNHHLLRGAAKIKTPLGHYHWVLMVRDRIVIPRHPTPEGDKFLADEGALELCKCFKVYDYWDKAAGGGDNLEKLPEAFQALLPKRRPKLGKQVRGYEKVKKTWSHGFIIEEIDYKPDPDGPEHPSPWVEPTTLAGRMHVDRAGLGSTYRRVAKRFLTTMKAAARLGGLKDDVELVAVWEDMKSESSSRSGSTISVSAARFVSGPDKTVRVRVHTQFHPPTWWVRCHTRSVVTGSDRKAYFLLAAGPETLPGSPVLANAVAVDHLVATVEHVRASPNEGDKDMTVVSGILVRDQTVYGGWMFILPADRPGYRTLNGHLGCDNTRPNPPLLKWDWVIPDVSDRQRRWPGPGTNETPKQKPVFKTLDLKEVL